MPPVFKGIWLDFASEVTARLGGALERNRIDVKVELGTCWVRSMEWRASYNAVLHIKGLVCDMLLLTADLEIVPRSDYFRLKLNVRAFSSKGAVLLYCEEIYTTQPRVRESADVAFAWYLRDISHRLVVFLVDRLGKCARHPNEFEKLLAWKRDFVQGFKEGTNAIKEGWDLIGCWVSEEMGFDARLFVVSSHPAVGRLEVSFPFIFVSSFQCQRVGGGDFYSMGYPFMVMLMGQVCLHLSLKIGAQLKVNWVPERLYASFNPASIQWKTIGGDDVVDIGKRVGDVIARQLNVVFSGLEVPARVSLPNQDFKTFLLLHFYFLGGIISVLSSAVWYFSQRDNGCGVKLTLSDAQFGGKGFSLQHTVEIDSPMGRFQVTIKGDNPSYHYYAPSVEILSCCEKCWWRCDDAIHLKSPFYVARSKLKDALKKFREFFLANFAMER